MSAHHSSNHRLPADLRMILFDLDGTLRYNRPRYDQAIYDYAVQLGLPDEPARRPHFARWTHYYWAQSPELLQDIQTYPDMDVPFWDHYMLRSLQALDCPADCANDLAPKIRLYMQDEYRPEDVVSPDVPETLQALQAAGYRLGLLSNRTHSCQEHLEQLGLHTYFEYTLISGEIGIWKPDPGIFHHALQHLGIASHQAIYVGDNYYADVVGAQRAGIQPVLLDPEGVFPNADCPVIRRIGDLPALLPRQT